MSERVRWYNRVAAWLWDIVVGPWVGLCNPVWIEQAEQDAEDEWGLAYADDSWVDEAIRDAYEEGYREGEHDWREP